MDKQYTITTIKSYPDNGKHQECNIGLPFIIRKGEDGYLYFDKNKKEKPYNIFKSDTKIDDRWIVHLTDQANHSLKKIFEVKCHKDLDTIIKYCVTLYKKSLQMEIKRLKTELSNYNK